MSVVESKKIAPHLSSLSLSEEASILHCMLRKYIFDIDTEDNLSLPSSHTFYPYDRVALFILSYISIRKPKDWISGRNKQYISTQQRTYESTKLSSFPHLLEKLDVDNYLSKKLQKFGLNNINEVNLIDIFRLFTFHGGVIKKNKNNYVNTCMIEWACGLRPVRLLYYIPSPMEVLTQQAHGERVVTMLWKEDEMSKKHSAKLAYMDFDGAHMHEKDALEFLLHDLKHMENFVDIQTNQEQVGFFKALLCLTVKEDRKDENKEDKSSQLATSSVLTFSNDTILSNEINADVANEDYKYYDSINNSSKVYHLTPKRFFCHHLGYDDQLWRELEYVISDMNTYVPHLLQYTLAKMLTATIRVIEKRFKMSCDTDTDILGGFSRRKAVDNLLLHNWEIFLSALNIDKLENSDVYSASMRMAVENGGGENSTRVREEGKEEKRQQHYRMTASEGEILRHFFRQRACL